MRTILAYGSGLRSHMGSTFYKNVGKSWSESGQNQGIWSEPGPYGSVWGHIQPEWILQGLGSLWDASRALKPPGKSVDPSVEVLLDPIRGRVYPPPFPPSHGPPPGP